MPWPDILAMVLGMVLSLLMSFLDGLSAKQKSVAVGVIAYLIYGGAYYLMPDLHENFPISEVLKWAAIALGTGGFSYSVVAPAKRMALLKLIGRSFFRRSKSV